MKVESFLKIVEEIEDFCLAAEQQEELITKVADLSRFIQSYDPSIEIINWMWYKVSIIKHAGTTKGIIFCDATYLDSERSYCSNANLADFKKNKHLKELWLVMINSSASQGLKSFTDIIEDKALNNIYDKIFSLNFLQFHVEIIK